MNASDATPDYIILWCLMVANTAYLARRGFTRDTLAKVNLFSAGINAVAGLLAFATHIWAAMWLHAGLTALCLLFWWISGGGGRTKKRLKKLKEKFVGQRRTAPQTA